MPNFSERSPYFIQNPN